MRKLMTRLLYGLAIIVFFSWPIAELVIIFDLLLNVYDWNIIWVILSIFVVIPWTLVPFYAAIFDGIYYPLIVLGAGGALGWGILSLAIFIDHSD